jgi:hypothetical protein
MHQLVARHHPLTEFTERIDPNAEYSVGQLADLMELSPRSVRTMAGYGWFPGARKVSGKRGGIRYVWTGRSLLAMADHPLRIEFDHDRFAPVTLYRAGCRCDPCTDAHNAASQERVRALAEEAFPAPRREQLLALVEGGMTVVDAAPEVGVTPHRVYARALWDDAFAEVLDEAAWSLCVHGEDSPTCGTAMGYRGLRRLKRTLPACRGTGCREWKREDSRRERASS